MGSSESQNCPTLSQVEGPNIRGGLQRQQQTNSTHVIRTVQSVLICHPKPIKATKGGQPPFGEDDLRNCDINSRLNRQQRFIDNDGRDDFTRELEDRIEADLEVENIFKDVPQARSLSLGKSLPERPGNPIVNDKLFKKEEVNSQPVDKCSDKKVSSLLDRKTYFDNRECSIEREKRILQEDFEAENEIHELLFSPEPHQNQSPTSDSLSSSSGMSSLEGEFAHLEQFGLIQHA